MEFLKNLINKDLLLIVSYLMLSYAFILSYNYKREVFTISALSLAVVIFIMYTGMIKNLRQK